MSGWIGKTVYTVNAKTNEVDKWICNGMFTGMYHNHKERLCVLTSGKKSCVLPKRFVYTTKYDAERVARKH